MAEPVDQDALKDSIKALTVIFILAILAANAVLVVKLLRRAGSRLLQLPQVYVLAALAFGDILVALFALVVEARSVYEDDYLKDVKCSTFQLAGVYPSFNAFVFSCGVIVLVLEMLVLRQAASIPAVLTSLVAGFLPYLVGLIVILPIAFAGFDWDKCRFDISEIDIVMDRRRALAALSYLVLPLLALIAAIVLKNYHKTAARGEVIYPGGNQPSAPQPYPPQGQPYAQPPQPQPYGQPSAPGAYPPPGQTYAFQPYTPAFSSPLQAQETAGDVMRQKSALLTVSVLAVIFYFPSAIFQLAYTLNEDRDDLDPIPQTALAQFVSWFTFLRPVITPLVFARI